MESLQSIKHLIHKKCFFASDDLKDAYFTIPVVKVHRNTSDLNGKGTFMSLPVFVLVC